MGAPVCDFIAFFPDREELENIARAIDNLDLPEDTAIVVCLDDELTFLGKESGDA